MLADGAGCGLLAAHSRYQTTDYPVGHIQNRMSVHLEGNRFFRINATHHLGHEVGTGQIETGLTNVRKDQDTMAITVTVFKLLHNFSPGGVGGFAVDLQAFDAMDVEDL